MAFTVLWLLPVQHCCPGLEGRSAVSYTSVLSNILPGETTTHRLLFAGVSAGFGPCYFDAEYEGVLAAVWHVRWQKAAWSHGVP